MITVRLPIEGFGQLLGSITPRGFAVPVPLLVPMPQNYLGGTYAVGDTEATHTGSPVGGAA